MEVLRLADNIKAYIYYNNVQIGDYTISKSGDNKWSYNETIRGTTDDYSLGSHFCNGTVTIKL